jgi:hypothetical protein
MAKKQEPEILTITVQAFYDRIAWLMWHGCYQEANTLRELAPWFTPPLRIDEDRVYRRVLKYIDEAKLLGHPSDWI